MKKLLFAGIAVSMLAACSNDEVVPVNNDSNAIKFGTTAEKGTRAEDIFCNNNKFEDFHVFASFSGAKYIDNDWIKYQNGAWENTSGMRYWPAGDVTFFGYKNGDEANLEYNDGNPKFSNFKVESDVADQKDLMYSRKTANKNTDSGKVTLNFRHALSQVVFNAVNTNENLYVEIEGVSVVNVYDNGDYAFPTSDSETTFTHPDATTGTEEEGTRGKWTITKSSLAQGAKEGPEGKQYNTGYSVGVENNVAKLKAVANKDTKTNLTDWDLNGDDTHVKDTDKSRAMLLLPSKESDYTYAADAKATEKTYFLVKCRIFNVSGEETNDLTKNVCLWGNEVKGEDGKVTGYTAKNAMIPFTPNWDEGKKYTYTFVFGNGNGGIDPNDPDNPVLLPITWDVTIDEFKDANPQPGDVEMDAPELPKKDAE